MKWWRKMARKALEPEKDKKLQKWQSRYEDAKRKYEDTLNDMKTFDKYYEGDKFVRNANGEGEARKKATNVRNICYELVESQVDSSIPVPKVTPMHADDTDKARLIEEFLKNEIELLDMKGMNDLQERTTPIQGACFTNVEWDINKGTHCSVGDLSLDNIHPREMIPQPGITEIEKMDYYFIRTSQTKEYIKKRFGKDVEDEDETDKEIRDDVQTDDIVTLVSVFYKNKENGIGVYRFCGDVVLEDLEDYEARHNRYCKKCGVQVSHDAKECPECGSRSFEDRKEDIETVYMAVPGMNEVLPIEVPYYKPSVFPLVIRKNISRDGHLLGSSDIER